MLTSIYQPLAICQKRAYLFTHSRSLSPHSTNFVMYNDYPIFQLSKLRCGDVWVNLLWSPLSVKQGMSRLHGWGLQQIFDLGIFFLWLHFIQSLSLVHSFSLSLFAFYFHPLLFRHSYLVFKCKICVILRESIALCRSWETWFLDCPALFYHLQ